MLNPTGDGRSREELRRALRQHSARNTQGAPPSTGKRNQVSIPDELLQRGIADPAILQAAKRPEALLTSLKETLRRHTERDVVDEDEEALPPGM